MKLFLPQNSEKEVFISVWKWCFTNCQSCIKAKEKVSFLNIKLIKNIINKSCEKIDNNFDFFLYWTEVLKHPKINEIIKEIENKNKSYKIQITSMTKKKDFEKLKSDLFKVVLSKNIEEKKDLIWIIESIKEFYWDTKFSLNIDLLIDLKSINYFEKILKTPKKKESNWIYYIQNKNIKIYFRQKYFINYNNKKIDNIGITKCLINNNFKLKWNHILINDHIEIDENLGITFHNPLCYLGQHKISNLNKKDDEIIQNIKEFNTHISNFPSNDFSKNCFDCITKNRFDYLKK